MLASIDDALDNPRWPLALGRRSFAPSKPVALRPPLDPPSLVEGALEQSMWDCPTVTGDVEGSGDVRYFIEHPEGEQSWFDQPKDDFRRRSFEIRRVRVVVAPWGQPWS